MKVVMEVKGLLVNLVDFVKYLFVKGDYFEVMVDVEILI